MTQKRTIKNTILVVALGILFSVFIVPIANVQGARVVGGIKAGSYFKWNFNYTGTDEIGSSAVAFRNVDEFTLTVHSASDGIFYTNYTDSGYRIQTPAIGSYNALTKLPLGTAGSHSTPTVLTLADVVAPIAMISVNWAEQYEYYVTDTSIVTIVNRNATHHTKYEFQGAWVDAHIFMGEVAQTHFGQDFTGYFRLVYSAKHGFMIEYEVYLESSTTSDVLAFTTSLVESNMGIGFSFFQNILVVFSATFGFQWVYSLALVGIIFVRKRLITVDYGEVAEDKEESEEDAELIQDEEGKIVTPPQDLPEDYNFIYECPFCGAKHEKYEIVCPECGGKR